MCSLTIFVRRGELLEVWYVSSACTYACRGKGRNCDIVSGLENQVP